MPEIETKHLKNLKKYKYSGVDRSLLSKPNLITLTGLLCIIVNLGTLLYHSPDLTKPAPNWVYLSSAIGLFVYQSLDAIDGKQARRTGTSSPLGQLFDHGCDALNASFAGLIACSALHLTSSWMAMSSMMLSLANFYFTTWEEFYTGVLYLGYVNGPAEGILVMVAALAWTSVVGPLWWEQSASSVFVALRQFKWVPTWLKMNHVFVFGSSALVLGILASSLWTVWKETSQKKSKVKPAKAFLGLVPFFLFVLTIFIWTHTTPQLLARHFPIVFLGVGIAFSNIVGKMIVAHVVAAPFPYRPLILLPFAVMAVAGWLVQMVAGQHQAMFALVSAYTTLGFTLYVHGRFVLAVISEICAFLGINCLTLTREQLDALKKAKTK